MVVLSSGSHVQFNTIFYTKDNLTNCKQTKYSRIWEKKSLLFSEISLVQSNRVILGKKYEHDSLKRLSHSSKLDGIIRRSRWNKQKSGNGFATGLQW